MLYTRVFGWSPFEFKNVQVNKSCIGFIYKSVNLGRTKHIVSFDGLQTIGIYSSWDIDTLQGSTKTENIERLGLSDDLTTHCNGCVLWRDTRGEGRLKGTGVGNGSVHDISETYHSTTPPETGVRKDSFTTDLFRVQYSKRNQSGL